MKVLKIAQDRMPVDEDVYLKENRYDKTKEQFKFLGRMIKQDIGPSKSLLKTSLLDVGCAAGECIYHLKTVLPNFDYYGMDISRLLIEKARKNVDAEFLVSSILDTKKLKKKYDIVVSNGVIAIYDNYEKFITNLLRCVKKGGMLYLQDMFNPDPVDVRMVYRYNSNIWRTGWNIIACDTIDKFLKKYDVEWNWTDFRMPFSIPKRDDPMRAWTIKTEFNDYQEINGACQLLYLKFLRVKVKKEI